ncbi:MAG: LysR family transcriptional regulator [Pseudomonadota bacterium]
MSKRIPSLNWLRVFEIAARTESFALAAQRLAMSPPAVSQQIRALEDYLGHDLFVRKASGVILTETGRGLLGVVGESLGKLETAASELSQAKLQKLAIGVSLTLSSGWLLPRLPEFLTAHPELSVEVYSLMGRPETPPLQAEIWIAFGQAPPGTSAHLMFGERLVPVAHPELATQIKTQDDLQSVPIIEVLDHRKNWQQILSSGRFVDHAQTIFVDTTFAALSLAAAKGGVALARAPASDNLIKDLNLKPCLADIELGGVESYYLLHASNAELSAGAVAFKAWVLEQAARTKIDPKMMRE